MENKIELINDEETPGQEQKKNEINNDKSIEEKTSKTKLQLTPELYTKLLKLFEKHFFIASVATKANIYRARIDDWRNSQPGFNDAITHARDKWLHNQMRLLNQYSQDKREKDWRALKYTLSIADKEYNDKKFMREDAKEGKSLRLAIVINQTDLKTSKIEALQLIGGTTEPEAVSLQLFNIDKKKDKDEEEKEPEKD